MKVLFVALGCLLICSSLIFGISIPQPQFVGSYSGTFSPTHCKKGIAADPGTFYLTVSADGIAAGYATDSLGTAIFAGKANKSGKVNCRLVTEQGVVGRFHAKIDSSGLTLTGKASGPCKFVFAGAKN
jgi:hypothetical protein